MGFEIVGPITEIQTIATGTALRDRFRLQRDHGKGRWRKCKGLARLRLSDGQVCRAEMHWYEAHGIGRVEMKIKRFLDD